MKDWQSISFRTRLVLAVLALTAITLSGAFIAVYVAVNAAQQRQLDEALRLEAIEEALEISVSGGQALRISARPGPHGGDIGPLTKYAVIYDPDGQVVETTQTFLGLPFPYRALPKHSLADQACFDIWFRGELLRGIVVPVPNHKGSTLLLAAPRVDLDGDAAFLAQAMLFAWIVAVFWAVLVANWVIQTLMQDHRRIEEVARSVAGGDLSARIGQRPRRDPELAALAHDIDEMIDRLSMLVTSQQRFIAHAAHELRSPLTALYGELTLALRRSRTAEEYRKTIEESLDASRRLKLLAEDLLALARLGAAREEPQENVDLAAVMQEVITEVRAEASARRVGIGCSDLSLRVNGNPRDLVRMYRNIIENAVRHSPTDSTVVIEMLALANRAEVMVCDSGPGVPIADRDRVFESFFRGSRDRAGESTGAGLGLVIAREIAHMHGGDIELLPDVPGQKGARFRLWLPLAATNRAEIS